MGKIKSNKNFKDRDKKSEFEKNILTSLCKNKMFKNFVISIFNKLEMDHNEIVVSNIHFKNNRIKMNDGERQTILCHNQSFLRVCRVQMRGIENSIEIDENTQVYGEGTQTFYIDGSNNRIIIGKNCMIRNTTFFIKGSNNIIQLEDNISSMGAEFHIEQNNNQLLIEKGTTFHGREGYPIHIALDEGSKVLIHEDCMFSNGIQIRSTDSHSIVDLKGKRLNPAENIIIEKHCWIGLGCIILKGTHIAEHTVVAAGTVCTKKYKQGNVVLAGNPAKIVKQEIDWDRKFVSK